MLSDSAPSLRPRERDAIIQSLRAGVTPRTGLQHIQVGRVREVEALLKDIETVCDGGSAFRLVIGEFGSGKSFFLQLVRNIALEKGLVTVHGDLSPDRRLHSTGGLCLLYTSDAADDLLCVDLGGRRIIKKKNKI